MSEVKKIMINKNREKEIIEETYIKFHKPRGYKLEDMIYPDRCMLKWQGFILSDHNEVIEDEKGYDSIMHKVNKKDVQEYEKWDNLLHLSKNKQLEINISFINSYNKLIKTKGILIRYTKENLFFKNEVGIFKINKNLIEDIY